jgi:hypothetical protein
VGPSIGGNGVPAWKHGKKEVEDCHRGAKRKKASMFDLPSVRARELKTNIESKSKRSREAGGKC